MIKSKTYSTTAGANYIEGVELVLTTIYAVKRSGLQYDLFATDANRRYIYSNSLGRIYFPIVFETGETVFVIYKETSTEVVPVPGICTPVDVPVYSLMDGVEDIAYNETIVVTGSEPFVLSNVVKPSWMTVTITGSIVYITGTPTTAAAETLSFDVTNCSGANTDSFYDSFTVLAAPITYTVSNFSAPGVLIRKVIPTPTIVTGNFPISYTNSITGVHPAYTVGFDVFITGVVFPLALALYKNSTFIQSISVTTDNDYLFNDETFLSTDVIEIILS